MVEQNPDHGIPEPGYKVRMAQAVERYSVKLPDSNFTQVKLALILKDFPGLIQYPELMDQIFQTADSLYQQEHAYPGTPEPGFKHALEEAIERYCNKPPISQATHITLSDIFIDHPDIIENDEFIRVINRTASEIFKKRHQ